MGTKILTVEISEEIHDRFYRALPRFKSRRESYAKATQIIVETLIAEFLDGAEKPDDKERNG
jgi:hypothetical protein